MNKFILYILTIPKLGIANVLYIAWYRISMKCGIRKLFFPQRELPHADDFFKSGTIRPDFPENWKQKLLADADKIVSGSVRYYARHWMNIGNPPDWFLNPFTGTHYPDSQRHWTQISEFNAEAGDIKNIWEASRFEWVVTLARAYSVTGESKYIDTLNNWLKDWALNNPLNTGPDWRCGQEASIRVLNLVLASLILKPSESLNDLLYAHLERISGNIRYAIAQDNNHGTTEAAGLFIGGSWLVSVDGGRYGRAAAFAAKGRKWIENRVKKLVATDGSFSQHSVNYHRVLIDTLTFAEYFRKKYAQEPFSALFYVRAKAAINWLYQMTDELSGGAPNLGANDGSLLNHLHQASYRDFRASLQLASSVFLNGKLYDQGAWDEPLWWLGENGNGTIVNKPVRKSIVFKSGYVILRSDVSWGMLRFPYFKFRPAHNDVFHFDLWYKGINVLCDAGSFSYNPPKEYAELNLQSVRCHNTVSFNGREQMPQLGRFLMGGWLKPDETGEIKTDANGGESWEGSYTDSYSDKHLRKISVIKNSWFVEDTLSGKFEKADIGFNINAADCYINGRELTAPFGIIITPEDATISLRETFISEYYNEKRPVQRLNIEVNKPGVYTTVIQLSQ